MTRWLGWLAASLVRHGQAAFFVDRLQPDWLSSAEAVRWYAVADRVWFRNVEDLKTVFPDRVPAP